MALLKKIAASRPAQVAVGTLAAWYLKAVWKTSPFVIEPPDIYDHIDRSQPIIVTMWHGQHFMTPFLKRSHHKVKSLLSRHRDGEINAIAASKLGIVPIRGSGSHSGDFHRKGGPVAFKEMLEALEEGWNVAVTADVPKVSRVAGLGIVKLAQHSGRPIVASAIATSRRIQFDNWDKSALSLPFSRGAIVAGKIMHVPRDASDEQLEELRQEVQNQLNIATARAYEIVDGGAGRG